MSTQSECAITDFLPIVLLQMQGSMRAIETLIRLLRSFHTPRSDLQQSANVGDSVPAPHLVRKPASAKGVLGTNALNPLEHFFHEHFSGRDNSIKNAADRLRPAFAAKRARALEQARRPRSPKNVSNCMTVDVNDFGQVSSIGERVTRKNWSRYESKIVVSTVQLLQLFDESSVKGTFFVLGWIAERYPGLVRRIADSGHEIASHGYWHQLVYNLTPEEFAKEVTASREAIFNACGVVVTAYRAPGFSIEKRSQWALEILNELGFRMDSSIFPASKHDRHGESASSQRMRHIDTGSGQIIEIPPTIGRAGRIPVPLSGRSFRLLPLWVTRQVIREFRNRVGPATFYLHPWELDPKLRCLISTSKGKRSRWSRFGITSCDRKLQKLLKTGRFDTMSNVLRAVMPESDYIPGVGCKAISDHSSSAIYVEPSAMKTLSISSGSVIQSV